MRSYDDAASMKGNGERGGCHAAGADRYGTRLGKSDNRIVSGSVEFDKLAILSCFKDMDSSLDIGNP